MTNSVATPHLPPFAGAIQAVAVLATGQGSNARESLIITG